MSAKDIAISDRECEHCSHPLYVVAYRWTKGDRIETEERGTPLGPIHSHSPLPPETAGNVQLCKPCDGGPDDGAVQRAIKRK